MNILQRHRNKFFITCLVGVFFLTFGGWFVWQPAVAFSKLNQLSVGMTTNQVQQIIGRPLLDDRNSGGKGGKLEFLWYYESPIHRRVVYLYFDAQSHYTGFNISSVGL